MKKTVIVSAFPACGKSYIFENQTKFGGDFSCLDSDSSEFSWVKDSEGKNTSERNPDFPNNYIQHIKDNVGKVDIIFVSSHTAVVNALEENNLAWVKVVPEESCKAEWMGDHSHTHMNLREIILWEGGNKHLQRGGVLSKGHYSETIAVGKEPECWCGGVGGGNTNVVEEEIFKALIDIGGTGDKVTHVKCTWKESETLGENYKWFLDEINRIGEAYGYEDTYLVVGFDS